jgi:hypothetical protein
LGDSGNAWGGSWVDYDNDGFLDLYISNEGQSNLLLRNENGIFSDQTPDTLRYAGASQGVAWGDYDNDGDQDLYLIIGDGANILFENKGDGQFEDVTVGPLGNSDGGQGAAWGDCDNDGDLDLYLTNWSGPNVLLRNEGGGTFTDFTTPVLADEGNGQSAVWGDYDNDGDLDLYLANHGQSNRLFLNEGGGVFSDDTSAVLADNGNSVGAAWADIDGDGDLDLYVANAGTANRLFGNNKAAGNHWLHVRLVGVSSNRSAIGARVRITRNGQQQIREVTSSTGYLSQNSLVVEFGLGAETAVDTLQVIWPLRIDRGQFHTTLLTDVPADQVLEIVEAEAPPAAVSDSGSVPGAFALHPCYPNPFNPTTTIAYELPRPASVNLFIYDISGRLVRQLKRSVVEGAGKHEVVWNGRDDRGYEVASGTYFYRLEAGDFVETRRMALIK